MTYILNTTDRHYTAIPATRIVARAAARLKQFLTATAQRLIALPSAIGAAFAMTYVDPYQQNRQQKDHSDPANF